MTDTIQILKALLALSGGKQATLADELDVDQGSVSRWLSGRRITVENRDRIHSLAIDKGILNQDPFLEREKPKADYENLVPEIDLTAGLGGGGLSTVNNTAKHGIVFSEEAIRDHWRLPDWLLARMNAKSQNIAAFPVQGDSMEPTLCDGDVIFVDTRHRAPSPDGIYALADEFGGVIVKRLEVISRPGEDDVRVSIISDNVRHRARELTLPEISIVGRYVGRFTL